MKIIDDEMRYNGIITSISIHKKFNLRLLPEYDITIKIANRDNSKHIKILYFKNCRDLDIQLQLCGCAETLLIESIKDWQWEECNYRVAEEISGQLSFYCSDFSCVIGQSVDS